MHPTSKTFIIAFLFALCVFRGTSAPAETADGILLSKHNLSIGGPGPIKAATEVQVCIFCHIPHHAGDITPLWSRVAYDAVYDTYSSTTRFAKPGQPTGSSRLCLSCHDGTIAVGALVDDVTIPMAGGFTKIPTDRPSNLGGTSGKNLSNDHPISFKYTAELVTKNHQLNLPTEISAKLKLDANQNLQCTTCHNAHNDQFGKFLVMDNKGSALCVSCHNMGGWSGSGHKEAPALATAGCGNCHVSHNAQRAQQLMKTFPEEENCLPCHSAAGLGKDIQSVLAMANKHGVRDTAGVHRANEPPLSSQEHVECEDCHNPHASRSEAAVAPNRNGRLAGVNGVALGGEVKQAVEYEYEVCFKCHADNSFAGNVIVRQVATLNTRLEFDTDNPSFHPVAGAGPSTSVPSLRTDVGLSTSSLIYCTDCHGSDQSVRAGGIGPNGPHGSVYRHLLLSKYATEFYPNPYLESNYALCYRCHNKETLYATTSPFSLVAENVSLHDVHVKQKGVPCFICHDPHGVSRGHGATQQKNAHLINFVTNFSIVASYDSTSVPKSCTSSCHTLNPATPRTYGPGAVGAGRRPPKMKMPAGIRF